MKLEDLGYKEKTEENRIRLKLGHFDMARVIAEHKERYIIRTPEEEYDAEIIGNLRFTAQNRSDFPAVGDWVAISKYDEGKALIHSILPRETIIERQAVGKQGEKQIIATNIDFALIVQAIDRDLNINRIERYLAICNKAKIKPVILLNKIDLISDKELEILIAEVKNRVKTVPIFPISNETGKGHSALVSIIQKGKTYCLLGSSGVGKSTLLNKLLGEQKMKTNTISESTNKGRHITTHRELFILDNGGLVIDNPGMREVGIADSLSGLDNTFDEIVERAKKCRFKDCTHTTETGCSVIDAVKSGEIDKESYQNYLKMKKEEAHFESTVAEKKRKDKEFGKIIRNYKKDMNKNR